MKTKLFTLLFALSLPVFMAAQELDAEELLLFDAENSVDHESSSEELESNTVKLLQLGNSNSAVTDQSNSGSFNLPNIVTAFQHGVNNEVFILQAGSGNRSTAIQQGIANEYELNISGDENNTKLVQQGSGNSVEQYINADGVDYTVIQQGLNNELIQIENNPEMPSYTIWQRGAGISVRIENVSVY